MFFIFLLAEMKIQWAVWITVQTCSCSCLYIKNHSGKKVEVLKKTSSLTCCLLPGFAFVKRRSWGSKNRGWGWKRRSSRNRRWREDSRQMGEEDRTAYIHKFSVLTVPSILTPIIPSNAHHWNTLKQAGKSKT